MTAVPPTVPTTSPVTTTVVWSSVVGGVLEELLHGLLDALGAQELVWRAGAATTVGAADGGRDLEATFTTVTPDGEVEHSRWWIEAKGRAKTVAKSDVVASVQAVADRRDVDVFVFCTNSRFSNPTRDWVQQWQTDHPRPRIKLWDRDRLDRLVRDHPEVAARILPDSLSDAQRLDLLFDRFETLGETPTGTDLEYFWEHRDAIAAMDGPFGRALTVAMFAYTDGPVRQVDRPWASLLPNETDANTAAVITAALLWPRLALRELPRPLDGAGMVNAAAYLLLAVIDRMPPDRFHALVTAPASFLEGEPWQSLSAGASAEVWREAVVLPIVARVQEELEHVCADDCVRVSSEPFAFDPPLEGKTYWSRFTQSEPRDPRRLIMESYDRPCAVGLPLTRDRGCPLLDDPEITLNRVEDLRKIVEFRRTNPEGQFLRLSRLASDDGPD